MLQGTEDHPFTIVVGAIVAVGTFLLLSFPWYYSLIAAMVVSGVLEFAIKEIPPDSDDYDPAQYQLWAAADSEKSISESTDPETHVDDAVDSLRNEYIDGEITEEEFEQKLETVLETGSIDNSGQTETAKEILSELN